MSNSLIKLIYVLNNEESSVAFDSSNKIASLKNLINLTQKINLDDYDVFYKKKEIKWTDETPIKNMIGKENVPIFYIKLKQSKIEEKKQADAKAKEEKKTDNKAETKDPKKADGTKSPNPKEEKKADGTKSPNPKEEKKADPKATGKEDKKTDAKPAGKEEKKTDAKPAGKEKEEVKKTENKAGGTKEGEKKSGDNKPTTAQDKKTQDLNKSGSERPKEMTYLKCKVIVENFPSRPEFYQLIDKYKENRQLEHEMSQLNTVSGVEVTFKNPVKIK